MTISPKAVDKFCQQIKEAHSMVDQLTSDKSLTRRKSLLWRHKWMLSKMTDNDILAYVAELREEYANWDRMQCGVPESENAS